ncbi:hypothetical protein ACROYT_G031114 [Oculina patagonica]
MVFGFRYSTSELDSCIVHCILKMEFSAEELSKLIYENEFGRSVLGLRKRELYKVPEAVTELTHVQELNLSDNKLTALPTSINKLKNLKVLLVSNNQLSELPETIGQLINLIKLWLNNNQLSELPETIGGLINLTKLWLYNNQLSELPETIGQLINLTGLWLDNNQLSELPETIGQLINLTELRVRNNQLSVLPRNIKNLKKLRWLFLAGNQLTSLPDDIDDLKELKRLDVDKNPFTVEETRRVVKIQNRMKYYRSVAARVHRQTAEGPRAQKAYEKALRDGYVNVYRRRILFIGPDRAGKTSLKKSLLGLPFDPKEQSTEGIEVNPSQCEIEVNRVKNWHSTHENKEGLLECSKDIAKMVTEKLCQTGRIDFGKDSKKAQTEETVDNPDKSDISLPSRKAKEVSNQDNASNGEHNPDSRSENTPDEPDVMINATSPPDDVTKHVHQWLKYAKGEHVDSDITKEESVVSMDMWDFAGQHLYYASHPLFVSSRALYILVHNLSKPLHAPAQPCVRQGTCEIYLENPNNETNMENLLSWLATIHSVTRVKEETADGAQGKLPYLLPPVFIVGTHADKPHEDISVMNSQIQKRISGKEYEKHVIRPLFRIDNTRSVQVLDKEHLQPSVANTTSLRSRVKKLFRKGQEKKRQQSEQEGRGEQEQEQEVHADEIQELQNKIMEVLRQGLFMEEKIPVRWFLFEKVIEALVAKQIYHRNLQQLQYYAKKECFLKDEDEFAAMISFYHDLGVIIKHRSTVVLKAQWLIDLLKQLITIPHFNKMDPVHSKYWQELERDGTLSMELVDHVFSKFIQQGAIKDDILDMMERFGLIAKFSASPSEEKYFVPAQLKSSPEELCKMEPSHNDPCPLFLHFVHGFVPHGLFSQLVSRSIRWCCNTWPMQPPKLYQNGAWFLIGKQIHDFVLICKKSFVKILLRQRTPSHQVLGEKSEELATLVREFVEGTLQNLSQELPYLSGLQYELCVACPYCHQGTEQGGQECSNHGKVSCVDEECFHLLEIKQDQPLICMKKVSEKVHTVQGLEKWLLKRTSQDLSPPTAIAASQGVPAQSKPGMSDTALRVTLLASEWSSSMGGLSTINRQLATLLAKHEQVEVTLLVPQFACSEEEKRAAGSCNVIVREAERRPGYNDPLDWLSFPPRDLAIDIVLGHGGKLGKQAQVIRESHSCKWVQVVHTAPEELGMHKNYPKAISKGEEKNRTEVDLCKLANLVVGVGPKLTEAYSSYLRSCEKHQDIIQLTPGTFSEFSSVKQAPNESDKFKVLTFGRGDPEDFSLKGYDIAAKAIVELKDRSYRLIFVGAPDGKQEEVAANLLQGGISKDQLIVRKFVQNKERLKELFCEADLAIMPSRTEGFGLTALEALSAGLPILVSGNSGFGDALRILPLGKPLVVDSADPKDWAEAIRAVRLKDRAERLEETRRLRMCYEENYSWEKQCEALVEKMWSLVHGQCGTLDESCIEQMKDIEAQQPLGQRGSSVQTGFDQMKGSEALQPLGQHGFSVESGIEQMKNSEALRPSGLQPEQMFQTLQQMQHSASEVNKRTDLSAELRKIASDRGFLISDNQGSGDCMFYALSEQLDLVKRIQISHQELRQTVVQYLNKNPHMLDGTDLFNFVHGYQTWADYLTNMEQDGTWGDHVILYAAANCYQTCIHVISSLPHHSDLTIRPEHPIDSTNPLVLGHVHELHYVSLEPKQALAYQLESGNDHSSKSCDQGAAQVCRQGTSQAD